MRPSQKQNRARGRGNRKPNGNVVNRVFESAGPEGKVRGTPQQIIDKYLTMARDSQTSGDRVMSENFLQHAEHYQRILLEAQGVRQEPRRDPAYADQGSSDQDGSDGSDGDGGRDDFASDETEQGGGDQDARRDERGERGGRGGRTRQPHAETRQGDAGDPGDHEVSGLTTIDSGPEDGENLLVEAEDLSASQPPRRRRNQRRDKGEGPTDARATEGQGD